MEGMATPTSYVVALHKEIEHAPVGSTTSEKQRDVEVHQWEERIEPELVAATAKQGRYGRYTTPKPLQVRSCQKG
jgi:hypothetical protein